MSLVILTESPKQNVFTKETYKKLFRKIFKKDRGPQAVTASIIRGLKEKGEQFELNPSIGKIKSADTLWVNGSIEALKFAIEFKKNRKDIKLVVGPNLVVTPDEHDRIVFDQNIDIILQPSEWTKKLYTTFDPIASSKIHIWPAGVADPYEKNPPSLKENYFIIYQKNGPEELFSAIKLLAENNNIPVHIIKYGTFRHEDYLSLLNKAAGMIYLSSSESQGIALQEAWIRNVPTLVWDQGFWANKTIRFEHNQISCPYLTLESGMTFKDVNNLEEKFNIFIKGLPSFRSRDYCLQHLTDKVTTAQFLDIIRS